MAEAAPRCLRSYKAPEDAPARQLLLQRRHSRLELRHIGWHLPAQRVGLRDRSVQHPERNLASKPPLEKRSQ